MTKKIDLTSEVLLFLKHMPWHTSEELIILKGHLLLDQMLRSYVSGKVKNRKYIDNAQIAFPTLVCIAWSFADLAEGNHAVFGHCKAALKKFNALRNKLAHRLEPEISEDVSDFTAFVKENLKFPYPEALYQEYSPLALSIFAIYFFTATLLRYEVPKYIASYGELSRIAAELYKGEEG
jgi:hypothetical protein